MKITNYDFENIKFYIEIMFEANFKELKNKYLELLSLECLRRYENGEQIEIFIDDLIKTIDGKYLK